jgi:hypothetical protein
MPIRGSTIATPHHDEGELKRVLAALGVAKAFDDAAINELYWKLGAIIGQWLSEQQRLEVSPVAKTCWSMAKSLSEVSSLLSGLESGLRSDFEIAVASQVARILALEPSIGSPEKAQELISSFRREAARIAHVCMVAAADLPDGLSERGRRGLGWYDDFTSLLFEIADTADIAPTLWKDRISGKRGGWLIEAAMALETFLYPRMRSPSAEACGTRLDRSKRRLRSRTSAK